MSNQNTPFGLKPVQIVSGGDWTAKVRLAYVSSSYATALFVGDPVDIYATNANKDPSIKHLSVQRGVAGGPFLGVIVGIPQELIPIPQFVGAYAGGYPNLNANYLPASTGGFIYIVLDQGDVIYEVQGDAYAVPSANWVGWNANMIATAAGNTINGLSGWNMDTGTTTAPATTNTLALHIIGAVDRPDNDLTSINAKWLVTSNNLRLGSQVAGIGS